MPILRCVQSLCYNLPMLEALSIDPASCALYCFPTKALAQVCEFMVHALGWRRRGLTELPATWVIESVLQPFTFYDLVLGGPDCCVTWEPVQHNRGMWFMPQPPQRRPCFLPVSAPGAHAQPLACSYLPSGSTPGAAGAGAGCLWDGRPGG